MTFLSVATFMLSAAAAGAEPGPSIGEPLPAFEAADQTGQIRHFEDLRGPNGLVLVIFRSADW